MQIEIFSEPLSEPQIDNIIEEAIPIIPPHNMLNPYKAHIRLDDFNENGYNIEDKDSIEIPYVEPILLKIEIYEPPLSPPI